MAFYNYECSNKTPCKVKALTEEQKNKLCIEEHPKGKLIWTERHGWDEKPEIKCPVCGKDAVKSAHGMGNVTGYIRGNSYLNRGDIARQMDLHTLETKDPYGHMRQPGEVDDLKSRLKKAKIKRR